MKFRFEITNKVDTQAWAKTNCQLENDLRKLADGKISEDTAKTYLADMIKALNVVQNEKCEDMLFLMFAEPASMPADARVDFVYRPTYIGATIMMTAMNRFPSLCKDEMLYGCLRKMLNAAMGRNFMGAGWESYAGLMDTLQIFATGDTFEFIANHREINEQFADLLDTSIQILETEICSGNLKNVWPGTDYRDRGRQVLKLVNKSMARKNECVWYACYGSNISKERFMRYIANCADTTPPVEDREFLFKHNIYFAKKARNWHNGGKAFLDDTCRGKAYGRVYKIKMEQFEQIKQQEGADYKKQLHLGELEGIPVYSFTDISRTSPATIPSDDYFTTILAGLRDCYAGKIKDEELVKYLISAIFPDDAFAVAKVIKENSHCMSVMEACIKTDLTPSSVRSAIEWLVSHNVIQQDSRSVRAGHSIDNMNALFYTVDSRCARALLAAMINADK